MENIEELKTLALLLNKARFSALLAPISGAVEFRLIQANWRFVFREQEKSWHCVGSVTLSEVADYGRAYQWP